jgi:multidrug efflux pump
VRGFITTPLERVIASADGIDYIESSSAQGVSTITVHLKLNYDTNAALTQVQAKVAQVRNDLPPEAEAPIIELATADTSSRPCTRLLLDELDQNQITDYLVRVVQPEAVGRSRACSAPTSWQPHVRDAASGCKPEKMAPSASRPSDVRRALREQLSLGIGQTKGSMTSVNLGREPPDLKTAEEFRQLVVKAEGRRRGTARRDRGSRARRRELRLDVRVQRPGATSWASGSCRTRTRSSHQARRAEMPDIQAQLPPA